MDELAALRAEVEALRKERDNDRKAELDTALMRQRASALNPQNSSVPRERFDTKPSDTALDYAAVLWAQMEAGMPGTTEE